LIFIFQRRNNICGSFCTEEVVEKVGQVLRAYKSRRK
jgi:hypothetical protein